MQPTYLPWLGYFNLIKSVDVFVIYDDVQFSKQSWQQRNKIRNETGEMFLTLPVNAPGDKDNINNKTIFNSRKVFKNHFRSINQNYRNAKNYSLFIDKIEDIYDNANSSLLNINMAFIKMGCEIFEINTPMVFSSKMTKTEGKNEAIIDICKNLGADKYLSPLGSKDYLKEELFDENGLELLFQEFEHPRYKQKSYNTFLSHLSFIDYIFNVETKNFKNGLN